MERLGGRAEWGVVLADIGMLRRNFLACDFGFVLHQNNEVAHVAARYGVRCLGRFTWEEQPPRWLSGPLRTDDVS
ncbi:hypothetical protein ACSBR2_042461 [Camellia fascicularis]